LAGQAEAEREQREELHGVRKVLVSLLAGAEVDGGGGDGV
jgi:hypothetical protein